jgi:hypothetical protein
MRLHASPLDSAVFPHVFVLAMNPMETGLGFSVPYSSGMQPMHACHVWAHGNFKKSTMDKALAILPARRRVHPHAHGPLRKFLLI